MRAIEVEFLGGKISVNPDRASVKLGDYVVWLLAAHEARPYQVRWEIYFGHSTPFIGLAGPYSVIPTGQPGAPETVRSLPALNPGDHKYGIRVIETASGKLLQDDDPFLIVRP